MPSTNVVAVRLPGGRLLIASLDPAVPDRHSPLRRHLRNETPGGRQGPKGPKTRRPDTLTVQTGSPREEPGEGQPGQTPDRAPR